MVRCGLVWCGVVVVTYVTCDIHTSSGYTLLFQEKRAWHRFLVFRAAQPALPACQEEEGVRRSVTRAIPVWPSTWHVRIVTELEV